MAPPRTPGPPGRAPKQAALDDLVMATNSSSIVSKRSVERIYYPDEPHFFRFFVNKFQRRSPLINRGYHLRLHLIDVAVRNFLKAPSTRRKVVINLGCGSDVLPWQCLTRYPEECRDVLFVDIDFPDLIEKKSYIVQQVPELNSMLSRAEIRHDRPLFLSSDQYVQIGCDLRNLSEVEAGLASILDTKACEFIFIAEVSITYMETEAADAVIRWAQTIGPAEFCLLEQIVPDGTDHPFADTMLRHFDKLKTSIKSVRSYSDTQSQESRFSHLGWPSVTCRTLWEMWADDNVLAPSERSRLNEIEPFDEWEEFSLFASHYCVVSASNHSGTQASQAQLPSSSTRTVAATYQMGFGEYMKTQGQRRFGAAAQFKSHMGEAILANILGLGTNTRLSSVDTHSNRPETQGKIGFRCAGPSSRMCHTTVHLGGYGTLVIGGRTSPSTPLSDCWLLSKETRIWTETHRLPSPLFRQATVRLEKTPLVLLVGGKTGPTQVFGGCLLYSPDSGWVKCELSGVEYKPVFGASLVCLGERSTDGKTLSNSTRFSGLVLGGLYEDGTMSDQFLSWELDLHSDMAPQLSFTSHPFTQHSRNQAGQLLHVLARFGSTPFLVDQKHLVIVGGIVSDRLLLRHEEVVVLDITQPAIAKVASIPAADICQEHKIPRPLLIGASVALRQGTLVVMGGGATCFSMGTYWNKGCYTLPLQPLINPGIQTVPVSLPWKHLRTIDIPELPKRSNQTGVGFEDQKAVVRAIHRTRVASAREFQEIVQKGTPAIIEGLELGPCIHAWSLGYLVSKIGPDREVAIHETESKKMDFNTKNFSYKTLDFGTFVSRVENGEKLYLRALSQSQPTDQPASLDQDFPGLAGDFQLPLSLSLVEENIFSSVLRISGPVNMWLHYDVMANIYCQVLGSKRVVLFPPSDVSELSFAPGASSSSLDVFPELESPALATTRPYEAIIGPGDVLFLPPLWLHTTASLDSFGVAVNVFFRNLGSGYSTGRDVYGNRDLAAYEKGRRDITRLASSFQNLPADMREFYLKRLADELLLAARD